MKKTAISLFIIIAAAAGFAGRNAISNEEKAPAPAATQAPPSQEELEKKFKETLTQATMIGKWRLVHDGKLGDEKEDKYTITSATKAGSDLWIILARIEYGGKDVTIPVPVAVKWAGDTPIISVTNAGLPGLGKYTARVLIYNNVYTGVWSGSNHGGTLTGTISKQPPPSDPAPAPKPAAEAKKES